MVGGNPPIMLGFLGMIRIILGGPIFMDSM
jgi:hypothetical protein